MKKLGFVLLGLLVFSVVVSRVDAVVTPWPGDWSIEAAYVDSLHEAEVVDPVEDMTICYVLKTDTYLFFRAVFVGDAPPGRDLAIYLDTVLGGQAGTDKGHSLHDLEPDYRVFYGSAPANLYHWDGVSWQFVKGIPYQLPDTYSVELVVELADIGNPTFPIGILFISNSEGDATDWNSDVGYLRYPRIVGGTVYPTQPWLLMFGAMGALALCAVLLLGLKRKRL